MMTTHSWTALALIALFAVVVGTLAVVALLPGRGY